MAQKTDQKVLALKEAVQAKKQELAGKPQRFIPRTTAIFEDNGRKVNIHSLSREEMVWYACDFKARIDAAEHLGFPAVELTLKGFPLTEWLDDVVQRIRVLDAKTGMAELTEMEEKLNALLSREAVVELEVDALSSLITNYTVKP